MKENGIFKSDGIVLLNKSKGISSFKAINKLKWIIKSNKVGHAGTLDPIAEGLLIVMVNNATKFSDNLMKRDKEYFVELELGYETATYDTEGEVTEKYEREINISFSSFNFFSISSSETDSSMLYLSIFVRTSLVIVA